MLILWKTRQVFCLLYDLEMFLSRTWESSRGNGNVKEDSTPISAFWWEGGSLTSVGALLQVEKLPPVIKIREFYFSLG